METPAEIEARWHAHYQAMADHYQARIAELEAALNKAAFDKALNAPPSMICDGCGSTETIEEIRARNPNALSCCPERKMVPISSAKEGGAVRHSEQVIVADTIRAALAKATGENP